MKTINARIVASVELDNGQRRDFDLGAHTIELEQVYADEKVVEVSDSYGYKLSSTEEGNSILAHSIGLWLEELGITDQEQE